MSNRYPTLLPQLLTTDAGWVLEHRFHPTRKWRFDAALPRLMLAIEIDGGIWTRGRHSRGAGQLADMEKGREAILLGWHVAHFAPSSVENGEMLLWVRDVICLREIKSSPYTSCVPVLRQLR